MCLISIPYLIEDESRLKTHFFIMHEVKECSKWGQMAGVLYTDQLVIDLFVTS